MSRFKLEILVALTIDPLMTAQSWHGTDLHFLALTSLPQQLCATSSGKTYRSAPPAGSRALRFPDLGFTSYLLTLHELFYPCDLMLGATIGAMDLHGVDTAG